MLKGRGADFFWLFLNICWDRITSCFGDLSHVTCHVWHVCRHPVTISILWWADIAFVGCRKWHWKGTITIEVTCHMSPVTCHMSHVTCHMSHVTTFGNIGMWGIKNVTGKAQLPQKSPVTCHMLHVTCHMSRVRCHMSHVTCHMLHVTCYMSHVTCHMSHVTCHVSHVTCHNFW